MWLQFILVFISMAAYKVTLELIPKFKDLFIKAGLYGVDMCKVSKEKV